MEEAPKAPPTAQLPLQELWAVSEELAPDLSLLSGFSPTESGPPKGGWGEDVSRVSSSQAPTQRENTQREGWAVQPGQKGSQKWGRACPEGAGRSRLEPPGPWGRPPPFRTTGWLAGTAGKALELGNSGDKGPRWGDLRAALWGGVVASSSKERGSCQPHNLGRERQPWSSC